MTTVQNTVRDPSGSPVAGATVSIRLVTGNAGVGYTSDGDVIGALALTADALGHWSQPLTPNSTITPPGTFYEVTETTPGGSKGVSKVVVPATGGPYAVSAVLAVAPTMPSPVTGPVPGLLVFSVPGAVTVQTGTSRLYQDSGQLRLITGIRASVGTPPVGGSIVVDVKKNGTSLYSTTGKPTITDGASTSGKSTPDVTAFNSGDYLTVDVLQVGLTTPGSDLTVQIDF